MQARRPIPRIIRNYVPGMILLSFKNPVLLLLLYGPAQTLGVQGLAAGRDYDGLFWGNGAKGVRLVLRDLRTNKHGDRAACIAR